jgi:hypothetical protein
VLAVRRRKILRMITSPGFLTRKDLYRISIIFSKFKHENVIKMKNKPDPTLLGPSNLSIKIKKRILKSRETIPLMYVFNEIQECNFYQCINQQKLKRHKCFQIVR